MKEELSFEEAMAELEKTVKSLDSEKLTLDDAVKKFEKGMELSKYCNELLNKAEKSISVLIENANGSIIEEPFEVSKDEL